MRSKNFKEEGLTIIEVIIYLGLLSIILTGSLATAFYLFESSQRAELKISENEEKNFVVNILESTLQNETNRSYAANGPYRPYELSIAGSILYLRIGEDANIPLTLNTAAANLMVSVSPEKQFQVNLNDQPIVLKRYRR